MIQKLDSVSQQKGLSGCSLLIGVPPEEIQRDCPTARISSFRHKAAVYRQGDRHSSIFCLLAGQITLARITEQGSQMTTAALGAGEFFGAALSGASAAEDTATAKGAVSVWRVPIAEFQRFMLRHPAVSWQFILLQGRRQRQLERRVESFAFRRVEARLAEAFLNLSGGFATRCEHGFGQHLRLTQQELADLVGATRPVVSTILNRLREEGVLGYNSEYVCVRQIELIESLVRL